MYETKNYVIPKHIRAIDLSVIIFSIGTMQLYFGNASGRGIMLIGAGIWALATFILSCCQRDFRTFLIISMSSFSVALLGMFTATFGSIPALFTITAYITARIIFNTELKESVTELKTPLNILVMDAGMLMAYSSSIFFLLDKPKIGQLVLVSGVVMYLTIRMFTSTKIPTQKRN